MHKLRKFYYDNKDKIWVVIGFIAFILIIIQFFNYRVKSKNEANVMTNNTTNVVNEESNVDIKSNISTVQGEVISSQILNKHTQLISEFLDFCNENEIENAYNMLSDECKVELYKNSQDFYDNYVKNIIADGNKKIATIENWIGATYKVNFKDDMMATGNTSTKSTEDYITIVKDDKINISNFIGKEKINKKSTQYNGVEITVVEKSIYMDYEEYTIKIFNGTNNRILIDSLESTKKMYITDNNDMKYYARTHEISNSLLKIPTKATSELKIKYTRSYSASRTIKSLVFEGLILDYNEYMNGNKTENKYEINV